MCVCVCAMISLSSTHSHLLLFSIHLYNLVLSNNICLMMRPAFFRASSDRQTRKHALRSTINIIAIIAIYIRFLLKIASLWVRQWSMWLWPATNRMQRERCSSPVMANNGIFGHWDFEKKWEWPFSFSHTHSLILFLSCFQSLSRKQCRSVNVNRPPVLNIHFGRLYKVTRPLQWNHSTFNHSSNQ